jgi:hypothetical protein
LGYQHWPRNRLVKPCNHEDQDLSDLSIGRFTEKHPQTNGHNDD